MNAMCKVMVGFVFVGVVCFVVQVDAAVTNGDFENGLTGWNETGVVTVFSEPLGSTNNAAVLTPDPFVSESGLSQAVLVEPGSTYLCFDYRLFGLESQETDKLYAEFDGTQFYYMDSAGLEVFDSSLVSRTSLGSSGMKRVCLDVSGFAAGQSYNLAFRLEHDHNDGIDTFAVIDNVEILVQSPVVPAPGALVLAGLGLLVVGTLRRIKPD